jgi:hypothetical protein
MDATLGAAHLAKPPSSQEAQNSKPTTWEPPLADVLKINSDEAFREREKDGAWGFVVRDSRGHDVLAGSGRLRAVHDALAAEGEACLAALNAAMDVGKSHVMLETDSLTLIAAIRSPTYDQAPGGVIFQEI